MNMMMVSVVMSEGTLSAQMSGEPWVLPKDLSAGNQAAADEFSWQSLVALNWPALPGQRGEPDPSRKIGEPGMTVWESYKTVEETFLPGAADPGAWSVENLKLASIKRLSSTSKVKSAIFKHVASLDSFSPEGIDQAVGGSLTDQNGNLTYYERALNEMSYDYVRTNKLYDASVLAGASTIQYPDWSMTLKAAWKILKEGKDDPAKFLSRQADIDGKTELVGLVGFHIVTKTPSSPQWIWSTFEHRDNAPSFSSDRSGSYSYYDPNCPVSQCPPNTSTEKDGKPTGKPTQVIRQTEIYESARNANATWQKELKGTVWENYELVGTQWPTSPKNPGIPTGRPQPTILANTTMETYIQHTSSCIQCHSTSASPSKPSERYDFTFFLFNAQQPASK